MRHDVADGYEIAEGSLITTRKSVAAHLDFFNHAALMLGLFALLLLALSYIKNFLNVKVSKLTRGSME